jgi:hypothetical protein
MLTIITNRVSNSSTLNLLIDLKLKQLKGLNVLFKIRDMLSKLGLLSSGQLFAILFKDDPDPLLVQSLKEAGWFIKKLPRNPYI